MKKLTQRSSIFRHLRSGKRLTPLDALRKFGCLRLAARISELRLLGWPIVKTMVSVNGSTFARYRLVK